MAQLNDKAWRRFHAQSFSRTPLKVLLASFALAATVFAVYSLHEQGTSYLFEQSGSINEKEEVTDITKSADVLSEQTGTKQADQIPTEVTQGTSEQGEVGRTASEQSTYTQEQLQAAQTQIDAPTAVIVHIDGAVKKPGVYELLEEDIRVQDLVEAAGGLAEGAETKNINLAAKLADGTKVYIPFEGEEMPTLVSGDVSGSISANSSGGGLQTGDTFGSALVNINQAGKEELMSLPGIGGSTADAILRDREQNGSFTSCEDLMRVSGIGEKKYAKLEGLICV